MNDRQKRVLALCDGVRSSRQIAELIGEKQKYVQEVMLKFDAPRRYQGSATGELNGQYTTGLKIDRDGYVLSSAPMGHPNARKRQDRRTGMMYEHRLVMEQKLGRYLTRTETVDHIDGLRLHNAPSNLRLFDCNADHLRATISGKCPQWSQEGLHKLKTRRGDLPVVHKYDEMKKSGDARLRQILLAALALGSESPYLLGSSHHLTKAGIVDLSRSSLERALADLYRRYA